MRYKPAIDGEWIQPRFRNYYVRCCDCGLVHRYNFRIVTKGKKRKIQYQVVRLRKRR